jgi:hypothetical protein
MINMIIGILLGISVCLFGLWCYIHGQKNAVLLLHDKEPKQIKTPTQVVSDGVQSIKDYAEKKDLEKKVMSRDEQIQNMLNS